MVWGSCLHPRSTVGGRCGPASHPPVALLLQGIMASSSISGGNEWVASYLDALLSFGLSSEYVKTTKEGQASSKAPDADRSLYSKVLLGNGGRHPGAGAGHGMSCLGLGMWVQAGCACGNAAVPPRADCQRVGLW